MNNGGFVARAVALSQFRNYGHLDLELDPGFNVVHGPNAQGKTNLLEALYIISTTRLLRTSRDAEAIQKGHDQALVSVTLEPNETELKIALVTGTRKRAFVNGIALKRASDLIGRYPSVSVSALDMDIVRGEPSERRLFLDLELSQTYPTYLDHLAHYRRALDQRNALLKASRESNVDESHFETWESALADYGSKLRQTRIAFVDRLRSVASNVHPIIAPRESITLAYELKDEATERSSIAAELERVRAYDVQRGATTIGPHRDDLGIDVDGVDLRAFGSQGQQRSGVITLKLATLILGTEILGAKPALFLDDVFSDLDEGRRARLVEWVLHHAGQAVLTCTEASAAGQGILKRAKLFEVRNGQISQP